MSVRLRECVTTEFDWAVKTGIGESVRKQSWPRSGECPLALSRDANQVMAA